MNSARGQREDRQRECRAKGAKVRQGDTVVLLCTACAQAATSQNTTLRFQEPALQPPAEQVHAAVGSKCATAGQRACTHGSRAGLLTLLWFPPVLQTLAYLIPVVQRALERRGLLGERAEKGTPKELQRGHDATGAAGATPAAGPEVQQGRVQAEERRQQQRTVQVGPWRCVGCLK